MREKSPQKDQAILDAALQLFLEKGVRGTTMEAIAKQAGVAKPTLYAYYPDKMTVFSAVIDAVVQQMKQIFDAALGQPGDLPQRIAKGLCDKYAYASDLLANSPHVPEIMTHKATYGGASFVELQTWLIERITAALRDAGRDNAADLASMLIASVDGLSNATDNADALNRHITFVTHKLLST